MWGGSSKHGYGGIESGSKHGYGDIESGSKHGYGDIESGSSLYPGLSEEDSTLRWGFIRKVYGILTTQVFLTAIVASIVVLSRPVAMFFVNNSWLLIIFAILPLFLLCGLYPYRQSHPVNLVLLGAFTVCLSLPVGISCAFTRGDIVLEALVLTTAIAVALTSYTYWAVKRGHDFSFLGPFLFASLMILIVWGLIQSFFPITTLSTSIYSGIGALIFSGYIIYDTENLIKRFDYDDYVWASIALYLDILNLFMSLLNILRANN